MEEGKKIRRGGRKENKIAIGAPSNALALSKQGKKKGKKKKKFFLKGGKQGSCFCQAKPKRAACSPDPTRSNCS